MFLVKGLFWAVLYSLDRRCQRITDVVVVCDFWTLLWQDSTHPARQLIRMKNRCQAPKRKVMGKVAFFLFTKSSKQPVPSDRFLLVRSGTPLFPLAPQIIFGPIPPLARRFDRYDSSPRWDTRVFVEAMCNESWYGFAFHIWMLNVSTWAPWFLQKGKRQFFGAQGYNDARGCVEASK